MQKYKSEQWLKDKVSSGYPPADIATECGVSSGAVRHWIRKYNIGKSKKYTDDKKYNNKNWLINRYQIDGMSLEEIAELECCDVSYQAIYQRLQCFNIKISGKSKTYKSSAISHGVSKDSKHLDDKWLYNQYINKGKTIREISNMSGVDGSPSSVSRALEAYGINKRSSGFNSGENHFNFNPDYNKYYGDNWNNIAQYIRERDDFMCKNCGVIQHDYINEYDRRLDVHHIIPKSEFDDLEKANKDENLITVCLPCHRKIESGKIDCPKI